MSYSTSQFQNTLFSIEPLSVGQALAQQDGNSSSEPSDVEEGDNQQTNGGNPELPGDSVGSLSENQVTAPSDGCPVDFVLDPTTGECDSTLGPCPEGETRGESGFCAVMPENCPPGTYINEDPLCEPCPTEGDVPNECTVSEPEPEPEPEPQPQSQPLPNLNNTTSPGNATIITINNAIAQAFSSTTYNTNILQQLAESSLIVGEETIPLQGMIKANDSRLLSTFEPFRLIGGSAIIYLPTSNISSSAPLVGSSYITTPSSLRIIALDGDTQQYVTLPSVKMSVLVNSYKTVLGEAYQGTNPFTGERVTVDNIKALYLLNESNQTLSLGYGSSVALLTIVR